VTGARQHRRCQLFHVAAAAFDQQAIVVAKVADPCRVERNHG